jgi:hypothetical protein
MAVIISGHVSGVRPVGGRGLLTWVTAVPPPVLWMPNQNKARMPLEMTQK